MPETGKQMTWHSAVREMPTKQGFSYPVFEWSYGREDLRGGDLRAWPVDGTLVFSTRRGDGPYRYIGTEGVIACCNEYSWGYPPNLDQVFEGLRKVREQMPFGSKEEAIKAFEGLKKEWEALAS